MRHDAVGLSMRRTLLVTVLALFAATFAAFAFRAPLIDLSFERAADVLLSDRSLLEDGVLHLHLCGTGIPFMDPMAGSACSAVVAAGEVLMIDTGAGALQRLTVDTVPIEELSTILITHFHSDHIGGLGDAINLSVFRGRERPLTIYGPPGVREVVAGFVAAYATDARLRTHADGGFIDAKWTLPEVRVVDVSGDESVLVFERGELRVFAFAMDHYPVDRALGYRIEYRGRSIAFAGDTRGDPRLAEHAKQVDILVHSAGGGRWFGERLIPILERRGLKRDAKLVAEGLRVFASPREVAKVAEAAHAKKLVLSHKPPVPGIGEFVYLWGMSDFYSGDVIYGRDGMRFDLAPP